MHNCAEIYLEEVPAVPTEVGCVDCYGEDSHCNIDLDDITQCDYNIDDYTQDVSIGIEAAEDASITLEWVCGLGFSLRILCGSDDALITIDGDYLIVKYKPES